MSMRGVDRALQLRDHLRNGPVEFARKAVDRPAVARAERSDADGGKERLLGYVVDAREERDGHPGADGLLRFAEMARLAAGTDGEKGRAGKRQKQSDAERGYFPHAVTYKPATAGRREA